jgi:hypothetical protein
VLTNLPPKGRGVEILFNTKIRASIRRCPSCQMCVINIVPSTLPCQSRAGTEHELGVDVGAHSASSESHLTRNLSFPNVRQSLM